MLCAAFVSSNHGVVVSCYRLAYVVKFYLNKKDVPHSFFKGFQNSVKTSENFLSENVLSKIFLSKFLHSMYVSHISS